MKSISKNSIYYIIYNLLNIIFPLVTGIYVSHVLLSNSIGEVEAARNLNEPEINKMLACLCAIYGLQKPLKIRWSMSSIINPTKNALRVTQLYNAQLISKKQALRELYPDLTENELKQIYNEIKEETSYNPEREIINDYNNF